MTYFTQDVTTEEGIEKKQFYISVGMQDFTTGDMVQVRQRDGEYSKDELLTQKDVVEAQLASLNEKIALFN